MSPDLEGRVALVTGAGRGIGRGVAVALAAAGARVLAVSRTEAELRALADETGAAYLVASVADEDGCRAAWEAARDRLGAVDVLVCNAGEGSAADGPAWELDPAVWRRIMALNVDAAFHLARLVLPDMRARGFGRVVMIASTAALAAGPRMAAYAASKHALLGLARSLAVDAAADGVTSNAVCPGSVRTAMAEHKVATDAERRGVAPEALWAERAAGNPAGRIVTVEEVAATVAFLCTPAAGGINGEAISVALGQRG